MLELMPIILWTGLLVGISVGETSHDNQKSQRRLENADSLKESAYLN